jgi:hypothetical protein
MFLRYLKQKSEQALKIISKMEPKVKRQLQVDPSSQKNHFLTFLWANSDSTWKNGPDKQHSHEKISILQDTGRSCKNKYRSRRGKEDLVKKQFG